MAEEQVFEFKGNALMYFRVRLRETSISVSTVRKRGGEAAKTWHLDFSHVVGVQVTERMGASTSTSALYLKPTSGEVVMFAWQKGAAGASSNEAHAYYAAAIATLRAVAACRPELNATTGPYGTSALIGATIGAIVFMVIAFAGIGELNATFAITAAAIAGVYAISASRSGAFKKKRMVSLLEAADELAAKASSHTTTPSRSRPSSS